MYDKDLMNLIRAEILREGEECVRARIESQNLGGPTCSEFFNLNVSTLSVHNEAESFTYVSAENIAHNSDIETVRPYEIKTSNANLVSPSHINDNFKSLAIAA
ncbi:hypothetical protein [Asaia bogorensis]|uniref:hypothetical protein n=1 Tax=Asaia bogorensis TaxID=91915 RepID=UPI000EFB3D97|nr:hypothetical protein [Asaia bogorensis]